VLDDQVRGEHRHVLGLRAHDNVSRGLEVDHRRRGVVSFRASQHDRPTRLVEIGDTGLGGAEVNSVAGHVTSL
jgi:hypothetical protein